MIVGDLSVETTEVAHGAFSELVREAANILAVNAIRDFSEAIELGLRNKLGFVGEA